MTRGCSFLAAAAALCSFACGDGGGFPDAALPDGPPPTGTFSLAWSLTDTNGAPVTCDQVGALTVTAVLRNPAVQGGSTEVFNCNTGSGTSPGIAPGNYQIDFELNGSSTTPVIMTSPRQDIEVKSGQNTPLMPISFAINATGGLALSLNALGVTAGNCETTANMGAGIDQFTITLEKTSDLSCAAVTFDVSAGTSGGTAGTYVVNCGTPNPSVCLHADQTLSVANVVSGGYRVHIRGRSGADCYVNNDTLPVPSLGMTTTRTLNLSKTTGTCP
jgi:hypothetical protein